MLYYTIVLIPLIYLIATQKTITLYTSGENDQRN